MGVMMLLLQILVLPGPASATLKTYNNRANDDFFMAGDINLGLVDIQGEKGQCRTQYIPTVQAANAVLFRINEVNQDMNILPNTSLGLVVLNRCWTIAEGLYQVTKLIPVDGCTADCCEQSVGNGAKPAARGRYNVAAVMIGKSSGITIPQSRLLSMYKIPHISSGAKTGQLIDKEQFGYFNRLYPSIKSMIKVLMDVLVTFNWTYISLIGSTTVYGREGITEIRTLAKQYVICIAYSVNLLREYSDDDYDHIVRSLRAYSKAKVVVIFCEHAVYTKHIDYYETLSPWTHFKTPGIYERHTPDQWQCSMELKKGENGSCLNYEVLGDLPNHSMYSSYKEFVDIFNVFIFALDRLIHQKCPSALGDKTLLRECVTGQELLRFIRKTSFKGHSGPIRFNANGDGFSNYDIKQFQPDVNIGTEYVTIGKFVLEEGKLYTYMERVRWFSLNETYQTPIDAPESVCAKPCKQGEFYIQGEEKCCWECRQCRDNEVVRGDLNGCSLCHLLTWPDQVNFTTCEPIPPSYMGWLDPIALGLVGISGIGLISTTVIMYIFLKHRKKKVVKGSSLEQMMTITLAMYLSYTTAILLVAKPVYSLCLIQYYSFHLSCTLTFVPLLLKTTRLYRIFAAAERCQQVVRFVSSKALALFSLTLISILVSTLLVCTLSYELGEQLLMPIPTDKFVEVVCHISSESLLIPLSFNLLLLLLCAVYGFLTRKLPDNFNESWYIFISVSTTLFVWLAFLPTYYMAFYTYHKSSLLGLALILNAAVTAVCLFAPKIYAIFYIPEESIKVTNFEGVPTTRGSPNN